MDDHLAGTPSVRDMDARSGPFDAAFAPNASVPNGRRLRVVLLPSNPWQPMRDAWRPGAGPDPLALYRHLEARGLDTVLIDPGRWPLNPFAGDNTVLQAADPLRGLRVLTAWRDADLVLTVFEGAALPLEWLRGLFRFRVPVVMWEVGLTEGWKLRERVLDQVVPRTAGVFVLSENQKDYIAKRWGRSQGVEVINHIVDTEFYRPAPFAFEGPVLSIGDDVGRDYDCLLDVAPSLDADIVIKTNRIPPDRALPPRVTVRRDRLDFLGFRDLYAGSRFVVVPLRETLNASGVSAILEASAMGRALVVSDTAAIRDFIVPGETCLTVPPGDREALAAAIRRLLAEPDTCARLGAAARRFVEARCAVPVFAERLAGLLRRYARADR